MTAGPQREDGTQSVYTSTLWSEGDRLHDAGDPEKFDEVIGDLVERYTTAFPDSSKSKTKTPTKGQ